jgi:hypothetical protein
LSYAEIVDVRQEIAARVQELSPELQEQVLQFVTSLTHTRPKGQPGASLLKFAGSLDPVSADEMMRAIEESCEQVDVGEW